MLLVIFIELVDITTLDKVIVVVVLVSDSARAGVRLCRRRRRLVVFVLAVRRRGGALLARPQSLTDVTGSRPGDSDEFARRFAFGSAFLWRWRLMESVRLRFGGFLVGTARRRGRTKHEISPKENVYISSLALYGDSSWRGYRVLAALASQ
eukprot:gb/GEZJ01002584.1/.p1 GENE.gb/GEZJ01002584.1/~~gb/GEZJ01002584.1/.p1  ORF type:complete len:151 (+),score=5.63 gb/GEZJ01002584.1/:314-766(+)